jgi:hypothetical protein
MENENEESCVEFKLKRHQLRDVVRALCDQEGYWLRRMSYGRLEGRPQMATEAASRGRALRELIGLLLEPLESSGDVREPWVVEADRRLAARAVTP